MTTSASRNARGRTLAVALATILLAAALPTIRATSAPAATDPCAPGGNPVVCENSKPGTPESVWRVAGDGDPSLQGYATNISTDVGDTVHFKIKTNASSYRIEIYRLGWYGGDGARLQATVTPSASLPQSQPACKSDAGTGLVDCGNWAESASWKVPDDAVSGIYLARMVRPDTGGESQMIFVVRNDASHSDLFFQASDETWQAYNRYGGNSLYVGSPAGRAYKVSYNRPFNTQGNDAPSWVFNAEYPMIRWIERNGYDVSYTTDTDTARRGDLILDHKTFMSVGHDEYWSAEQRANVEAARSHGVNLAFFTANELFWKTRWEDSIDGSSTSYRTLVCYKETKADAKIDPTPTWTGTWRDPRFSPPADGGRPENALSGTMFMVDAKQDAALQVPAQYSGLRFWRNTPVASLAPGTKAVMPVGTLGYEWDEDVDNGSRPAGLFELSSATYTISGTLVLDDYGNTYGNGTATHHLTMYRAPSGALVFGAGTVQWSWGLDASGGVTPDPSMKQATVNLLADMGAQPSTLESDLVPATQSTDDAAPTSAVTSPSDGAVVPRGSALTISGTATDTGGGVVAGVEVSTDGGTTWHPANGTDHWTYGWNPHGSTASFRSRAVDDSGNLGPASAPVTVNVGACPCSVWTAGDQPSTPAFDDGSPNEPGMRFRSDDDGWVTALRFYKGPGNTGTHIGHLWSITGTMLADVKFKDETATGWQEAKLPAPVAIKANTTYIVSYYAPSGHYSLDRPFFAPAGVDSSPLHALTDGFDGANGVFFPGGSGFPQNSYQASNYWVDLVFDRTGTDTVPPEVSSVKPADGASGTALSTSVTAKFSEPVDTSTIDGTTFELTDPSGATVPATVTYNATTRTATLKPASRLTSSTRYTATVSGGSGGVKDAAGNPMSSDFSWSFTTSAPATCPCSLFGATATPATPSFNDGGAYELGVKFTSDTSGYVTAVRFYKGSGNTGTHVGHLWTADGRMLAEATFTSETGSGWQQVDFGVPVPIQADTTYIASYHTNSGHYALDRPFFDSDGVDNGPLHGLADGEDGPNAVFQPGAAGFPDMTYQASNYWVDVVFAQDGTDTTPPTVSSTQPQDGATGVAPGAAVTVHFDEPLDPASVDASTFELRDSAGAVVPADVTYDAGSSTATLTPSSKLDASASYTATVSGGSGGVEDVAGNSMAADYTWSFTTATPATGCPCTIWSPGATPGTASASDNAAYELGVRFRSDVDGFITGVRFYKGDGNTGTHTGHLWASDGTMLAQATFTGESATGWQQVDFGAPVAIKADTTYIVSYHTDTGHYALDRPYFDTGGVDNSPLHALRDGLDGGNGVFNPGTVGFPTLTNGSANYWVDAVFSQNATDTVAPTVLSTSPAAGATSVSTTAKVTARFSEDVDPDTISGSTFHLQDTSTGTSVGATVTYDASSQTATLTPSSPLTLGDSYRATVDGGGSGVKDPAGNALGADVTWTFSTPATVSCPCSIWNATASPSVASFSEAGAYELGVKLRSDLDGFITGIRFYKGPDNTGTHVGHLWSSDGTMLAEATFTSETASGWQQVNFLQPVPIQAHTTYIASYHTDVGHYALDRPYFTASVDNGPLHAPADQDAGGNGVFNPGGIGFPTMSNGAANYWVDAVFSTSGLPSSGL